MATRNVFIEDFKKILETIPDTYSLPQWQFAYRQVVYSMGLKILEKFPNEVVAPDPSKPGPHSPAMSPGNPGDYTIDRGPGPHPNTICRLVCLVLDIPPPRGKNPPDPS